MTERTGSFPACHLHYAKLSTSRVCIIFLNTPSTPVCLDEVMETRKSPPLFFFFFLMQKTPYCKLFYSRRVCVCIFVLFQLVTVFRLYSKFSNFAGFYRKYNPTALQTKQDAVRAKIQEKFKLSPKAQIWKTRPNF